MCVHLCDQNIEAAAGRQAFGAVDYLCAVCACVCLHECEACPLAACVCHVWLTIVRPNSLTLIVNLDPRDLSCAAKLFTACVCVLCVKMCVLSSSSAEPSPPSLIDFKGSFFKGSEVTVLEQGYIINVTFPPLAAFSVYLYWTVCVCLSVLTWVSWNCHCVCVCVCVCINVYMFVCVCVCVCVCVFEPLHTGGGVMLFNLFWQRPLPLWLLL